MATQLYDIVEAMQEHDREYTKGSESAQWQAFVADAYTHGYRPLSGDTYHDVDRDFAAYWLAIASRDYVTAASFGDVDPDWIEEAEATAADKVAALLGGDGQVWETADGRSFESLIDEYGGQRTEHPQRCGDERIEFPDGSIITVCGDGWDLGFAGCFCLQGAGHADDCEEMAEYVDRLRLARVALGLTQEQLGARWGVTKQTIWRWEGGAEHALPRIALAAIRELEEEASHE